MVSASFGVAQYPFGMTFEKNAINALRTAGILFVAAAGNGAGPVAGAVQLQCCHACLPRRECTEFVSAPQPLATRCTWYYTPSTSRWERSRC